jgi:enterochelin esterase-like enzyme
VLRDWQSTHLLPQPLQYRVYLPPCYDEHAHRRYPVLYLIHGQSYTDDQWDRLGADETASALIVSGEVLPFIIVMPRDMVWTQPSEDGFGEALVQVLIPTIEEEYRTLPGREFRAIGGLSRGASWAIHLGLSRWQLFSAIGAHSPPVFWEDIHSIALWLEVIPAEALPRIYMDIGEDDRPEVMDSAVWFEGVLTSKGLPHEWHLFQGEHDEDYWKAHVEQYLRWYAGGW